MIGTHKLELIEIIKNKNCVVGNDMEIYNDEIYLIKKEAVLKC